MNLERKDISRLTILYLDGWKVREKTVHKDTHERGTQQREQSVRLKTGFAHFI